MHVGLGAIFAFVALTGLYLFAADLFAVGYFPVLLAHIVVGLLLAVVVPIGLGLHLKRTSSPGLRSALPLIGLLAVPIVLVEIAMHSAVRSVDDARGREGLLERAGAEISLFLWGTDGGDGATVWMAATFAVLLAIVSALLAWAVRERDPSVPVRWTGVIATAALMLAVTTGLTGWLGRGDARFDAYAAHSLLGLLTLLATAAHFKAPRRLLGRVGGPIALLLGAGLIVALWGEGYADDHVWRLEIDVEEGVLPVRVLRAQGDDAGAPIPEELLLGSDGCGDAGCHEQLTHQWAGSAHRFSADNALYRAVIDQLVQERDPSEARFCAGCHDPVRALAGTAEAAYADGAPAPSEGVNCVVCHVLIGHDGVPGNGDAHYRAPVPYPGADREARKVNIKLDPRYHRMTMTSGRTVHPELCGTCHRVELGPFMGAAVTAVVQATYAGPTDDRYEGGSASMCSDCHLPTITRQPNGQFPLYDHQMAGINFDLGAYVTHPDADREAIADVRQRVSWMVEGANADGLVFPPPPFVDEWPDADDAPGVLDVDVSGARRGDLLAVTVMTSNARIGHPFPVGPFDLREVWLQVVVRDSTGAAVGSSGLPVDGRVPEEARRLGAVELDRSGQPLQRHRIWDVGGLRGKRLIPQGESVTDRFEFALPEGTAGPLQVEAAWQLRRANPDFTAFALGPDHPGFDTHEVARGAWSE